MGILFTADRSLNLAWLNPGAKQSPAVYIFLILGLFLSDIIVADPIHDAAKLGDIPRVRALVDKGVALASKDESGNTPLHFAALNGHDKLTAFLVDAGAPINAINDFGVTALMLAEDRDHYDLAKWLVLHGADATVHAADGFTVFTEAWRKDRWDFVRFLFLHGVDPEAPIPYYVGEAPPLVAAAWEGEYEMVEWLLQRGVNVNTNNTLGMSPLHEAARKGSLEIARLLLKHGADVNSRTSVSGTTPLHAAVAVQNIDMVRVLIDNGADVNVHSTSDEDEWKTPLTLARHMAYQYRRSDDPIVALLLQHGAKMPDKLPPPEAVRPSVCQSEKQIKRMNRFSDRDRLARYVGQDARLFVETAFFWWYGKPGSIDDSLYDTVVVWSLQRVQGVDLAALVLFKDGCALEEYSGTIFLDSVTEYIRIVKLIQREPDSATLRAALLELANRLRVEVEPDEVVSEFLERLQGLPGE